MDERVDRQTELKMNTSQIELNAFFICFVHGSFLFFDFVCFFFAARMRKWKVVEKPWEKWLNKIYCHRLENPSKIKQKKNASKNWEKNFVSPKKNASN